MEKWALHWPSNQHLKVYKISHSGGQKFVWNGILLILEQHMLKNKFKEQFCQRCFSQRYNWVSKSDTGAKGPIHLGGSRGIHLLKTWSILSQRQTLSTSPTLSLNSFLGWTQLIVGTSYCQNSTLGLHLDVISVHFLLICQRTVYKHRSGMSRKQNFAMSPRFSSSSF